MPINFDSIIITPQQVNAGQGFIMAVGLKNKEETTAYTLTKQPSAVIYNSNWSTPEAAIDDDLSSYHGGAISLLFAARYGTTLFSGAKYSEIPDHATITGVKIILKVYASGSTALGSFRLIKDWDSNGGYVDLGSGIIPVIDGALSMRTVIFDCSGVIDKVSVAELKAGTSLGFRWYGGKTGGVGISADVRLYDVKVTVEYKA